MAIQGICHSSPLNSWPASIKIDAKQRLADSYRDLMEARENLTNRPISRQVQCPTPSPIKFYDAALSAPCLTMAGGFVGATCGFTSAVCLGLIQGSVFNAGIMTGSWIVLNILTGMSLTVGGVCLLTWIQVILDRCCMEKQCKIIRQLSGKLLNK